MTERCKRKPLVNLAILAITGTAARLCLLNKDECMLADWRLIGYQDGVAGKSAARVGEYREDCAKHAVVPDLDAYRAGRQQGLQQYCKASNGFRLGNAGHAFAVVCPTALEGDFRDGYNSGRERYLARSAVNNTHSHINQRKQQLSNLEDNRAQKLAALVADGIKSDQRVMILYELNELQQEMNSVEEEILELEDELVAQQSRLDSLSRNSAF